MAEKKEQVATSSVATTQSTENKTKLATEWPLDYFVVRDLPTVTREGVEVTDSQRKSLEEAAKNAGVTLREVK
jgi:hypothetical protein